MIVDLLVGLAALAGLIFGALKYGAHRERRKTTAIAEEAQERRREALEQSKGMTDDQLAKAISRGPVRRSDGL